MIFDQSTLTFNLEGSSYMSEFELEHEIVRITLTFVKGEDTQLFPYFGLLPTDGVE